MLVIVESIRLIDLSCFLWFAFSDVSLDWLNFGYYITADGETVTGRMCPDNGASCFIDDIVS